MRDYTKSARQFKLHSSHLHKIVGTLPHGEIQELSWLHFITKLKSLNCWISRYKQRCLHTMPRSLLINTVVDCVSTISVQYGTLLYSTVLVHAFLWPRNITSVMFSHCVRQLCSLYGEAACALVTPSRSLSDRSLYANGSLYGWFTSLNTVEKSVPKFKITIRCAHYTVVHYTGIVAVTRY